MAPRHLCAAAGSRGLWATCFAFCTIGVIAEKNIKSRVFSGTKMYNWSCENEFQLIIKLVTRKWFICVFEYSDIFINFIWYNVEFLSDLPELDSMQQAAKKCCLSLSLISTVYIINPTIIIKSHILLNTITPCHLLCLSCLIESLTQSTNFVSSELSASCWATCKTRSARRPPLSILSNHFYH